MKDKLYSILFYISLIIIVVVMIWLGSLLGYKG